MVDNDMEVDMNQYVVDCGYGEKLELYKRGNVVTIAVRKSYTPVDVRLNKEQLKSLISALQKMEKDITD